MQIRSFSVGLVLAISAAMMPAQQAHATVMVEGDACTGGVWVSDDWGGWVCVTTQPESDGGGGGPSGGDGGGGGGGGDGGDTPTTEPLAGLPSADTRFNSVDATCASDVETRHAHASEDVRKTQAKNMLSGAGMFKAGSFVAVTYDDGATEVWQITDPRFSDPISNVPVTGSLKCD